MRPYSKKEAYWRDLGQECRRWWQMNPHASKSFRRFTRRQCNKAMRIAGKKEVSSGILIRQS